MIGWHHQLNGHEFEQALGDGEGQEVWHVAVHGVSKSWTWLSNWTTTYSGLPFSSSLLALYVITLAGM